MGILVVSLDTHPSIHLLELVENRVRSSQLILSCDYDNNNVGSILDFIGDYPISEIRAYVKPDTRPNLDGVKIDNIIAEISNYECYISHEDLDFLKALSVKLGASVLKIFSSFRRYQSIWADGAIVDHYIDHDYIIANIVDSTYHSINVCSPERLQKAVTSTNASQVMYASQGSVPELYNINNIDPSYYETLGFLHFVLYGRHSYEVDIVSGGILLDWDSVGVPKHYELSDEERKEVIAHIRSQVSPKIIYKKRTPGLQDILVTFIMLIAGILLSSSIFNVLKMEDMFTSMETLEFSQSQTLERLESEERYLSYSIENYDEEGIYVKLLNLDRSFNNGAIMGTRFLSTGIEVTVYVLNESTLEQELQQLSEYYTVVSSTLEQEVSSPNSSAIYQQYSVILEYLP